MSSAPAWLKPDLEAQILNLAREMPGRSREDIVRRGLYLVEVARAEGRPKGASKAEVIEAMKTLAVRLGSAPTGEDWERWPDAPCSLSLIRKRHGKWSALLEAAGLAGVRSSKGRQWSDADLLDALRAAYQKTGEVPTKTGWGASHPEGPSDATFIYRFGRWNAALEAAGLPTRKMGSHRVEGERPKRRLELGRNRQMVTAGAMGTGPVPWDRAITAVESSSGNA